MVTQGNSEPTFRFRKVCEILDRNGNDPTRLIPVLHEVQREYRYLPREILTYVATALGLSPAKVYGVASFYSHFTLKPKGKYILKVCDGTACHVKNSSGLNEVLQKELGLSDRHTTTDDMLFTLETVSCLGACGLAPVLLINEEVHGQVTPQRAKELLWAIMEGEGVR